jgi:hypothetical protein
MPHGFRGFDDIYFCDPDKVEHHGREDIGEESCSVYYACDKRRLDIIYRFPDRIPVTYSFQLGLTPYFLSPPNNVIRL